MASPLNFNQLKVRFNTWLRDSGNLTWTDPEKIELLQAAINEDPYVFMVDQDTFTSVANQPSYPLPSTITEPMEITVDMAGDGYQTPLDRSAWDVVNGNIYFTKLYKSLLGGKTVYVIGKRKLTDSDLIPVGPVQAYILHLATAAAFEMLKTSLTSRFVRNDITMSEIINSISTHNQAAGRLRDSLVNQRLQVV